MSEPLKCSFCGTDQHHVRKLIAGPNGVFICDTCVFYCVGVIMEAVPILPKSVEQSPPRGPQP